MKTENGNIISKSEAARRWGLTPSAVTAYVEKGLPVRADGQLDWGCVSEWRRQYIAPERSGNFSSRQAKHTPSDFDRGARYFATEVCIGARRALPKFVSTLTLADTATKATITAAFIFLIQQWAGDYVNAQELPAIDWSAFGADAKDVGAEACTLMSQWKQQLRQEAR